MSRNIFVEKLNATPIEEIDREIVERKGIGHPDSISDGIAESVSCALSNAYLKKFGGVLHHNTDEVQITAGESNPQFGGGEIIKPIDFLLTGRGVSEFKGEKIAMERIAITAAKDYLRENIKELNVETDAVIECKIGRGSGDLVDVFDREGMPHSNDTSFGVSYAPFSETETIVLETEELLNSPAFKKKHPAVGTDIKVMGLREKDKITLTVACAMVDKYVDDVDAYKSIREEIAQIITDEAQKKTDYEIEFHINTGDDDTKTDESGYFLTVTGTSAEMGDDGSVGRGNRANGLITPNRPMSMEATSGKNPINHVGKIYNILASSMAQDVAAKVEGVQQINIILLSQIGRPIDEPKAATSQILVKDGYTFEQVSKDVESIMDTWLEDINTVTTDCVEGKARTF